VKILRYVTVDDSGTPINAMIVEGQVHGGVFNGIAASLYECFLYDKEGQLLTASFADYLSPTAVDVPSIEISLMETPSPFVPLGAKGVGESGALGPQPTIINAIEDALSEFGVRVETSHITPELVRGSIKSACD
jgi:carbon-monoxide dehydrogenase large subunit